MNVLSLVCCTPPSTPSHRFTSLQFFENLNPLQDFKDNEDFENYVHEQSKKIEPKNDKPYSGRQKYPPEALKSPGIKTPTAKTPKALKSPSAINRLPHAGSPDESHFGIVEINPGHAPKYLGNSGRVNGGFSGDTPLQTPILTKNKGRTSGGMSSPSMDSDRHFRFPPTTPSSSSVPMSPTTSMSVAFPTTPAPGALVLNKPPFGKGHHKPPPPPPPTGTYTTLARKKPPPPPPPVCEPSTSSPKSTDSPKSASTTPGSPMGVDMNADISLLKPATPSMTPPKSPSVSLSVPLPPRARTPETYDNATGSSTNPSTPALCPPRPPKPHGSRQESPVNEASKKPELEYLDTATLAPPIPPKTYRKNFASSPRA
uniref:WH2 domain-containing protein n=1 Tax=Panagrellus redivivus TaxID=6233 RepID=A0A7E4V8M1_PANRE